MHLDVSDLKGFYDLPVGQVARQLIRKRIHEPVSYTHLTLPTNREV